MQYVINPFTGALDAVGAASGGASAPVAAQYLVLAPHAVLTDERVFTDGVGLLGTDAGAGSTYTLDLNINELTSETTPTASDLFPFLDVDVSTSPTGARKVTLANLATAISTSLGGPFQPLDAGLTALASLGAGIAVSDGADGWFARSIAVTDTATIDFTVTNASGVAGNPTITGSVIPGGITHSTLAGLTTGDAGHTQFLLLAGRTGTANDATITTTVGGTGSLYGGSDVGASLYLSASSSGSAHTGTIQAADKILLRTVMPTVGPNTRALDWVISTTIADSAANLCALNLTGSILTSVNRLTGDIVWIRNVVTETVSDPLVSTFFGGALLSNQPNFIADTGVTILTGGSGGLHHGPKYSTSGTGTIVSGIEGAFSTQMSFSGTAGSITGFTAYGFRFQTPAGTIGGAAIDDFIGIDIESFGTSGAGVDASLRSAGNHVMMHNGNVMIGSSTLVPLLDLDINGDFGTRSRNLTLSGAGPHNDIGTGAFAVTRITGPAVPFTVTGMNNPILGRHVWLVNTTSQAMSVTNDDAGSTAGQRILTPGGGTVTRNGPSVWKFWYDSTTAAWRLHADEFTSATGAHNFLDSTVHNNTLTGTPTRGDLIVANSTPAWATFGLGGTPADKVLTVNGAGTDPAWAKLVRNNTGANTGTTDTFVFQTAPTLVTSVTVPLVIGGTGATDDLTLRSSSGAGGTSNDIIFQVGNNGATEAARILGSGLIGIATATPAVTLDINGILGTRVGTAALANAENNDVSLGGKTVFIATGGGGSCAISGFAGGADGYWLVLFNNTGSGITIENEDVSSTAANRIQTVTGGNITLTNQRSDLFVYDPALSRWREHRFL